MSRLALITLALLALAFGLSWFADHAGRVVIDWQGRRIETSFAALTLLAALIAFLGGSVDWIIDKIRRDTPFLGRDRRLREQQRGLKQLNRAVIALAGGDSGRARTLMQSAEALLPAQPIVDLLAAQAESASGAPQAAAKRYQRLRHDQEGALLGLRGLLLDAVRHDRAGEALSLAEEAYRRHPKSRWIAPLLFQLQVRRGRWRDAQATLKAAPKALGVDAATLTRHQAALIYLQAGEAQQAGNTGQALKLARQALKTLPEFVPAATLAVTLLGPGDRPQAQKLLKAAWAKIPHPELAAAFAALKPMESPAERLNRFRTLTSANSQHRDSRTALAEVALAADQLEEAEKLLDPVIKGDLPLPATERVWKLQAEIEERRAPGAPEARAKAQAARAAAHDAAADPRWVCSVCADHRLRWTAICPSCRSFNGHRWVTHQSGDRLPLRPKPTGPDLLLEG